MRTGGEATGRKRQGRYELGDLLGRGGMAEVFAGHTMGDHGFSKPVAIKRLLPELANDEVFVDRLIEEAKLLVGLAHGNIVSVMDLAREGDDVFLVMEFVDGPSLRQLLKARQTRMLSLGTTCYVITAAATGLEFAHQRSVIHADISPSNILLTTSGEVRVADFGIARNEGSAGPVEGKWAYMAPEQARGESLDAASDVFALGVTMYELMTGQHPFGRQVTADDRSNEPLRVIPPRVHKPAIPVGLDAICMRMLAVDRRDRFQTMQQVIDAITDERYTNRYREGAADLASAIREIALGAQPPTVPMAPSLAAKTVSSRSGARPVASGHTIVTRSLLSQPRAISNEPVEPSSFAKGTVAARGDMLPVVTAEALPEPSRKKWAFVILGVAGVVGAIAAVGLSMSGTKIEKDFDATEESSGPVAAGPVAVGRASVPAAAGSGTSATGTVDVAGTEARPTTTSPTTTAPTVDTTGTTPTFTPTLGSATTAPTPPVTTAPTKPTVAITAPKKKEPGTLRLSTSTWGYVSIDGGGKQEITLVKKFSLAPGKHTVRVSNDDLGLPPMSHSFIVEPGKTHVVKVDLESGSVKESD